MVQPGSAVVMAAARSARTPRAASSAMTVTWTGTPAACGAATSTPTSAWSSWPGGGQDTDAGCGVVTAGPSTRTVRPASGPAASGPSPARVTRTIARGRAIVPPNRSVEVTSAIRMPASSHEAAARPSFLVKTVVSSVVFRNMSSEDNAARGPAGTPWPGWPEEAHDDRPHLEVRDPKMMRALAHPMRVALIEAIGQAETKTLTATEASELLDESPANCAFHLRTLAKYGFVEEAGGGRGRERPWRRARTGLNFSEADDSAYSAAVQALQDVFLAGRLERLRAALARRASWPAGWQSRLGMTQALSYLTPAEEDELSEE